MRSRRVLISEDMVERLARGEARLRRDFKLKYGRYCIVGLARALRRLGLGSEGKGEADK